MMNAPPGIDTISCAHTGRPIESIASNAHDRRLGALPITTRSLVDIALRRLFAAAVSRGRADQHERSGRGRTAALNNFLIIAHDRCGPYRIVRRQAAPAACRT